MITTQSPRGEGKGEGIFFINTRRKFSDLTYKNLINKNWLKKQWISKDGLRRKVKKLYNSNPKHYHIT
jgi:hypothetical protein